MCGDRYSLGLCRIGCISVLGEKRRDNEVYCDEHRREYNEQNTRHELSLPFLFSAQLARIRY